MADTFSASVDAFVKKTGMKGDALVQHLAMEAMLFLIKVSFVDTGNFRDYWRLSRGTPVRDFDPTRRAALIALGHGRSGGNRQPPIPPINAMQSMMDNVPRQRWGDPVWITNHANYGGLLNLRRPMLKMSAFMLVDLLTRVRP